jgi:hypothetical protein
MTWCTQRVRDSRGEGEAGGEARMGKVGELGGRWNTDIEGWDSEVNAGSVREEVECSFQKGAGIGAGSAANRGGM